MKAPRDEIRQVSKGTHPMVTPRKSQRMAQSLSHPQDTTLETQSHQRTKGQHLLRSRGSGHTVHESESMGLAPRTTRRTMGPQTGHLGVTCWESKKLRGSSGPRERQRCGSRPEFAGKTEEPVPCLWRSARLKRAASNRVTIQ